MDYARGEYLIKSVIDQISDLRNEQAFNEIYEKAKQFSEKNGIDFLQQLSIRRTTAIPSRFKDCFINSTLGRREKISSARDFIEQLYFPLVDAMLIELHDRFSSKTLSLMKSIATVYPESIDFLNVNAIDEFADHIGAERSALKNEYQVLSSMFAAKKLANIFELFVELLPLSTAFPQTIKMIRGALTMPVSQVTCERSFSKMKIIKNYLRNSMTDNRLSDLTLLSIERDIVINYESIVDAFAQKHKNVRILLC